MKVGEVLAGAATGNRRSADPLANFSSG